MKKLRGTLISDGTSDRLLIPIIHWTVCNNGFHPIEISFPNLNIISPRPRSLREKVQQALLASPCDVLFLHRDAEAEPPVRRIEEIESALVGIPVAHTKIIPVRMSEAWLLICEPSIRKVSGRPRGTAPLDLPRIDRLERLPDPKTKLIDLIICASEARGRRLVGLKQDIRRKIHQLSDFITDYSILRELESFQMFETDLVDTLRRL